MTVIDPGGNLFRSPVPAGGAVLNGAGECTGFVAMAEWGLALTNCGPAPREPQPFSNRKRFQFETSTTVCSTGSAPPRTRISRTG